jgi:hypothetical protein
MVLIKSPSPARESEAEASLGGCRGGTSLESGRPDRRRQRIPSAILEAVVDVCLAMNH